MCESVPREAKIKIKQSQISAERAMRVDTFWSHPAQSRSSK
jgi:hypothetical protein